MSSKIKLKRGRNVVVRNSFTDVECVSEYSLGADSVLNYNRMKMSEYGTDFIFSNSNTFHVFYKNRRRIIVFKYKINFFFFMRLGSLPRCQRTTCTHY